MLPSASVAVTWPGPTASRTSRAEDHPGPKAPGTLGEQRVPGAHDVERAAMAGNATSVSWWTMLPLAALIGSSIIPDVGGATSRVAGSKVDRRGGPPVSPAPASAAIVDGGAPSGDHAAGVGVGAPRSAA